MLLLALKGIVIGTGEKSEFGEIYKMMQAEEVIIELPFNSQTKPLNTMLLIKYFDDSRRRRRCRSA